MVKSRRIRFGKIRVEDKVQNTLINGQKPPLDEARQNETQRPAAAKSRRKRFDKIRLVDKFRFALNEKQSN
jgi:hypothetical protein